MHIPSFGLLIHRTLLSMVNIACKMTHTKKTFCVRWRRHANREGVSQRIIRNARKERDVPYRKTRHSKNVRDYRTMVPPFQSNDERSKKGKGRTLKRNKICTKKKRFTPKKMVHSPRRRRHLDVARFLLKGYVSITTCTKQ